MSECVDLKTVFGKRCRIRRDPAFFAEYGPNAYTPDPWYWIIPTRTGHLYPWGGDRLAASIDGHPGIAKRLKAVAFLRLEQDGSDGATFTFHVDDFAKVAKLVKPHRKRQMTAQQREAAAERARANLPKLHAARQKGLKSGSECDVSADMAQTPEAA